MASPLKTRFYQRFPALSNSRYRGFFVGQLVSMTGSFMQAVAVSWYAYRLSDSAWVMGLMGFCMTIPSLFISPIAGVLADRISRRNLLIGSQIALAAQAAFLLFLSSTHSATVPLLLFASLWMGIAAAVEIPVRHSIYADMLDDKSHIPNAIALNALAMNSSRMIGPALGGLIVAWFGETACFLFNLLSFSILIAMLFRLDKNNRSAHTSEQSTEKESILTSLVQGISYAKDSMPIRTLLILLATNSIFVMHYGNLIPVLVKEIFGGSSTLFGSLMAAAGVGSLIASIRLAVRKNILGLTRLILLASLTCTICLAITAWSPSVTLTMFSMCGIGFGVIATVATVNVVLQSIVDDDKRARIMSLHTMAFIGTAPLGNLLFGWLAELWGIRVTFTIAAMLTAVATIWFALQRTKMRDIIRTIYEKKGILPPRQSLN